jgi:16S rRNA (guanine527-N7)-methyltransferase
MSEDPASRSGQSDLELPGARDKGGGPPGRERERLERGLESLEIPVRPGILERLLEFIALVRKWNASHGLVARGDTGFLVERHILDSLAIHAYIRAGTLLDVGSGAGLPGVPLAIARPDLEVTLLDGSGKKARFMRHVKRTLGLGNTTVWHNRLETIDPGRTFGSTVCRAYGSLVDYVSGVRRCADPRTRILAMKGRMPVTELEALPGWIEVERVARIEVPDLHAERHLVIMCLSPDARMSNNN